MSYAILIPARKNSKRLSGKNFIPFNGQPLLDKTVEFAMKFGFPVYVSTDWHDYKFKHPVTLIKRPAVLARDDTDMRFVVEHAREKIKEDVIILLQPTSPLRDKGLVRACISEFEHYDMNIVTINQRTCKPNGACFIFPKNEYIWDYPIFCIECGGKERNIDIDYIWDFRIAEAIERGDYS